MWGIEFNSHYPGEIALGMDAMPICLIAPSVLPVHRIYSNVSTETNK